MNQMLHPKPVSNTRTRIVAATLGLGAFLTQFDVTSVIMAMPAIGRDLDLGVAGLTWVVDSYSLAFTVALLAAGALTDRFGRRRALLMGNMVFLLASIACGLARNGLELWAARAAQGIGAAFVITAAIASIAAIFPSPQARARAFGIVGVMSGISMALGPTLGAVISSGIGWRWIFFANLPFCVLIAIAVPRLIVEAREERGRSIDWPSVAVLALALGFAIEAFLTARESLLYLVAGLAVAAMLFAVFIRLQRRQPIPLFDPTLFRSRPMAAAAILLIAMSIGYWALLVYLPMFFGAALGWSGEMAGLGMLILTLPMLVIPPVAARLGDALGWRYLFSAALAAMALGGMVLAVAALTADASLIMIETVIGMLMIGTGAAVAHPQLSGIIVALAPADAAGMASAITVVARQGGFAIGVAMLGAAMPSEQTASGFAGVFAIAAAASALGAAACVLLPHDTKAQP